jgi:hypothetical protein
MVCDSVLFSVSSCLQFSQWGGLGLLRLAVRCRFGVTFSFRRALPVSSVFPTSPFIRKLRLLIWRSFASIVEVSFLTSDSKISIFCCESNSNSIFVLLRTFENCNSILLRQIRWFLATSPSTALSITVTSLSAEMAVEAYLLAITILIWMVPFFAIWWLTNWVELRHLIP